MPYNTRWVGKEAGMERLEAKKINGHTYYYYSKWAWVEGKCRRVWQRYLGKLEDIAKAVEGGGPAPICAEVFQWGCRRRCGANAARRWWRKKRSKHLTK